MSQTVVKAINVVKGKNKAFNLDIDKGDDPFDLTSATEVKVCFPGDNGTPVELSSNTAGELSITNAALGKVSGNIPAAKSDLLKAAEEQDIQVEVTVTAGEPEAVILSGCLNVVDKIC